tara:strand:- start:1583 stop:1798 length:216 start_codon:yes stop_codon:yes gene_type:complete
MSNNFLQHQVDALQKELVELIMLSNHSTDILDTLLEKSNELELDDREYISLVNKEMKEKLDKLKFLIKNGK